MDAKFSTFAGKKSGLNGHCVPAKISKKPFFSFQKYHPV